MLPIAVPLRSDGRGPPRDTARAETLLRSPDTAAGWATVRGVVNAWKRLRSKLKADRGVERLRRRLGLGHRLNTAKPHRGAMSIFTRKQENSSDMNCASNSNVVNGGRYWEAGEKGARASVPPCAAAILLHISLAIILAAKEPLPMMIKRHKPP